jgi:AraC-like DNA-binding protein
MACHTLVYTDQSIALIAAEHGFADQSYFTREFRDVIGQTPRDYRRSFQGRRT